MVFGVITTVIREASLDMVNNLSFEEWKDCLKSCNKDWREDIIKRMESLAKSPKQIKQLHNIKSKMA